jgi:hypothetical protein
LLALAVGTAGLGASRPARAQDVICDRPTESAPSPLPGVSREAWSALQEGLPEGRKIVFGPNDQSAGERDGWAASFRDYAVLPQRNADWPDIVARMLDPQEESDAPKTYTLIYFRADGPGYEIHPLELFTAPSVPRALRALKLDDRLAVAVTSETGGTADRQLAVYRLGAEGGEKVLEETSPRVDIEPEREFPRVTLYERVIGRDAEALYWPRAFTWNDGRFEEGLGASRTVYQEFAAGALKWLSDPTSAVRQAAPSSEEFVRCMGRLGEACLALQTPAEALYWLTRAKLLADDTQASSSGKETLFAAEFELSRTEAMIPLAGPDQIAQIERARASHRQFQQALAVARKQAGRPGAPAREPVSLHAVPASVRSLPFTLLPGAGAPDVRLNAGLGRAVARHFPGYHLPRIAEETASDRQALTGALPRSRSPYAEWGDFNGDGRVDAVVQLRSGGTRRTSVLVVFQATPEGEFRPHVLERRTGAWAALLTRVPRDGLATFGAAAAVVRRGQGTRPCDVIHRREPRTGTAWVHFWNGRRYQTVAVGG